MSTETLQKMAGAAKTKDKPANAVAAFSGFMDKLKPQLALALPKHLNPDRMVRLALTAFSTSPDLQRCTPQSIAASIMTAAQLGLEPGVNGQGYLIPYENKRNNSWICTFVPGWKGLVDLVSRSGRATVWTGAVYPGDHFEYELGDAPFCRHKPGDNVGNDDTWTHVYAIGRVRDAQMPVIEVWTRAKVMKHLALYNKVGNRHYAKQGENNLEMYARKVALLQVLKYMPSSIELQNGIDITNAVDAGKGVVLEGNFVHVFDDGGGGDDGGNAPDPAAAQNQQQAGQRQQIGAPDPTTGEITGLNDIPAAQSHAEFVEQMNAAEAANKGKDA